MYLDFWYNNTLSDVVKISCTFNGCDCVYRGWMFDKNGQIIGDYSTTDSLLIEKTFKILFK